MVESVNAFKVLLLSEFLYLTFANISTKKFIKSKKLNLIYKISISMLIIKVLI